MPRRFVVPVVAVALFAVAPAPSLGAETHEPTLPALFKQTVRFVRSHHAFRHAVMLEADGRTASGRATGSAAAIVRWSFELSNPNSHLASVRVSYGPPPKRFGKVHGSKMPFLEDVVLRSAPRMTVAQAVTDLRRAGHRRRFVAVTLRHPLYPGDTAALYIFKMSTGRYVAVNTHTGKIAAIH